MTERIHILATCTDRKRVEPPAPLRLRSVHAPDVASRARRWWSQLDASKTPHVAAHDLYAGDHWAVARSLSAAATDAGLRPQLWVISAGYGLVSAEAPVRPYSATFVRRHADSVWLSPEVRGGGDASEWWQALSRCGPKTNPRSILALVQSDPRARLLVIAAPAYIEAIETDLAEARQALSNSERLLIVSSRGCGLKAPLAENVIIADARLQATLGGARGSLNARVARRILEESPRHGLDASAVQRRHRALVSRSPAAQSFDRERMSDEDVVDYVEKALAETPPPSCSALLRRLRDSGRACEQHRFKALYHQTAEDLHVGQG